MNKFIRTIMLILIANFSSSAFGGAIELDLRYANIKHEVFSLSGNISVSDIIFGPYGGGYPVVTEALEINFNNGAHYRSDIMVSICPFAPDAPTATKARIMVDIANQYYFTSKQRYTPYNSWGEVGDGTIKSFRVKCTARPSNLTYFMDVSVITVVPPIPPNSSICEFSTNNDYVEFVQTSLDVDGITKSKYLYVNCTSGTPIDYSISLRSNNNNHNGRLDFRNGVSAQILLNGTPLVADGRGVTLRGLTSGSIPYQVKLFGGAYNAGVTNTSGTLVISPL